MVINWENILLLVNEIFMLRSVFLFPFFFVASDIFVSHAEFKGLIDKLWGKKLMIESLIYKAPKLEEYFELKMFRLEVENH